ncbi:gliding motility lipoprotein GldH [Dysgonomonas sp. 521]|uniref:gliding motility lipoprotein GldH n=1 Tax=Dysgonomonas sp. 521 TaxID=2302932 RepID=UPI0013D8DF60|nr:gliding motility lipoprotein GldH [Dysgonomonas sp. 521]NDV95540.1 gliding motility lipoprotein GldH [Dysgonomonas sp. 521]
MEIQNRKGLKHKVVFALCCVLFTFINISCDEQEIYSRFHELKNAEWAQNDTLVFDIDSTLFELDRPYSLTIELTNNVNYPYQNIWFFVQSDFESDTIYADTSREFLLADEFGKWKGSGFGSLYQSSLPFAEITFKEKRNYRVKLEQGMRDQPLAGIERVGIRITKIQ